MGNISSGKEQKNHPQIPAFSIHCDNNKKRLYIYLQTLYKSFECIVFDPLCEKNVVIYWCVLHSKTTISINYVKSSLPPPPPPPHMPGGGMSLIDTLLNDNSFIVLMNHQIFFPILTLQEMLVLGVNLHKELLGFPSYGHLRLQIDF